MRKVIVIDKESAEVSWEYQLEKGTECNCARLNSDGEVLMALKTRARLVSKNKDVIWDFKVNPGEEVQTVHQLEDGNYFLAVCAQPSRFITLDQKGKLIKEQNFDLKMERNHSQFRQVTPLDNGNLIIPVFGKGEVIEVTPKNKVIKRVKVGGNPFSVKVVEDGNWLISCGDAHKFVVVDPKTETIVKSFTDEKIKEYSLYFVAETHLLDNGNYLVSNWNGHVKDKSQPKMLEITEDYKVVWKLPFNEEIKNISSVYFVN